MTNLVPKPRVGVEYDCRGERKTKEFDCSYAARRFYVTKMRQGKRPKVVSTKEK